MGLSREEERALQEIEEQLAFDDPDLDALLTRAQPEQPAPERKFSMGLAAWWVLAVLAYLVFVIGLVMTVATPPEGACHGGPCEQPVVPKIGQIM
ncbi:DUF3040 domain-containing protein [Nonomuraea glycinis]|uniref:DUF3040 domain-containing protein n=1 Tax=Nonomuraea glycinis TaxID=2047744 RepID=UPI002E0F5E81|nr:DUF3040 domain-containing protein [Nonomuraea glycinis]